MVVIIKFKEIIDCNQVEELNGVEFFIDWDQLLEFEEDEFYYFDFNGLSVCDFFGEVLGKVVVVQDFGVGDFLEIWLKCGKMFYVLFMKDFVLDICVFDGMIIVDFLDDYLLDEKLEFEDVVEKQWVGMGFRFIFFRFIFF